MIRTSALTATALAAMLVGGVASAQTTAPAPSAAPPPSTQAAPPSQPTAAAPSPSPSTQAGATQSLSPDTIQSAQQALQQNGFYKGGKVDGKMGPKTRQAIRSFQHAKGLQASGHLNQRTLSALGVSS